MATVAAKAIRRAHANQRLADLSGQIAEKFGVSVPESPRKTHDADLDQIMEVESVCNFLQGLLDVPVIEKPAAKTTRKPAAKKDA